jgi:hypothetical protein
MATSGSEDTPVVAKEVQEREILCGAYGHASAPPVSAA